jgi:UDP-2,3-diacylglucosamine pyrophosphatase LpxH
MSANPEHEGEPRARPYDCLVISDLHLGSDVCQAALLEGFLEWAVEKTRELVINGDIFDDLNFTRLSKRHFACLKLIRRNSDRGDLRLVWVRGNHDGPAEVVGHVVGVEVVDEYVHENDRLRLLILHGDQFDRFVNNYGLLTELACGAFYYIQKWAPHHTVRYIRRVSKQWQRSSLLIRDGAVAYAASKGFRHVTCGHTHIPVLEASEGVLYANSGTWIEHPPCPFISVKGEEIRLEYWPAESAVAAPSRRAGEGAAEPLPSDTPHPDAPRLPDSVEVTALSGRPRIGGPRGTLHALEGTLTDHEHHNGSPRVQ